MQQNLQVVKQLQQRQAQKSRIKAILNGGVEGLTALLGNSMDAGDADLLPAPNLLQSGIDRLAQKYQVYLKYE